MESKSWTLYTEIKILQEKKRRLTEEIKQTDYKLRVKTKELYKESE